MEQRATERAIFSVKDLSERWDIDDTSVRKMVADGRLTPLDAFKTLKFSLAEVERIEGLDRVNPLSPFERKRLELVNEKLQKRVYELEGVIHEIAAKTCLFVAADSKEAASKGVRG